MTIHSFPMLIGSILSIAGLVFMRFLPKKINKYYGDRTPQAFRNQKSWGFCTKLFSKAHDRLECLQHNHLRFFLYRSAIF